MEEKQRLIDELDQSHQSMQTALKGIDPRLALSPTWTVQQVIAHIAGWDDATIKMLRAHVTGEPLNAPEWLSIDHYNAQSVETRRPLSYQQTVNEWKYTRIQLKEMIEDMPADKVPQAFDYLWGQRGTIAQLVAIMAHHEAGHARTINRFRSTPPEVR